MQLNSRHICALLFFDVKPLYNRHLTLLPSSIRPHSPNLSCPSQHCNRGRIVGSFLPFFLNTEHSYFLQCPTFFVLMLPVLILKQVKEIQTAQSILHEDRDMCIVCIVYELLSIVPFITTFANIIYHCQLTIWRKIQTYQYITMIKQTRFLMM